jgi:Zn-dependent protease
MKPAPFLSPEDETSTVGRVFNTPLVVKGKTWLPVTQLVAWGIMTWLAGKEHPKRPWWERIWIGGVNMAVMLGSEWGHNLSHAAAANAVGQPMDALRVSWGMPLVIYYDIAPADVTPQQHIIRSLGGPLFNVLLLPLILLLRRFTRPDSVARQVANTAAGTNAFLLSVGMLPMPVLDGGPVLKWTLVTQGCTPEEADQVVRKVNGGVGLLLGLGAGLAFKQKRRLLGALLAQLSAMCLGFALGIIQEQ